MTDHHTNKSSSRHLPKSLHFDNLHRKPSKSALSEMGNSVQYALQFYSDPTASTHSYTSPLIQSQSSPSTCHLIQSPTPAHVIQSQPPWSPTHPTPTTFNQTQDFSTPIRSNHLRRNTSSSGLTEDSAFSPSTGTTFSSLLTPSSPLSPMPGGEWKRDDGALEGLGFNQFDFLKRVGSKRSRTDDEVFEEDFEDDDEHTERVNEIRQARLISERRRRDNLRVNLEDLKAMLPTIPGTGKLTKSKIIERAVQFLKNLKSENEELKNKCEALQQQNDMLSSHLTQFYAPDSNRPPVIRPQPMRALTTPSFGAS